MHYEKFKKILHWFEWTSGNEHQSQICITKNHLLWFALDCRSNSCDNFLLLWSEESYLAVLKFNFIKKRVHKRVQRKLLLGAKNFYIVLVKMTQMSQNDFKMTQMGLWWVQFRDRFESSLVKVSKRSRCFEILRLFFTREFWYGYSIFK